MMNPTNRHGFSAAEITVVMTILGGLLCFALLFNGSHPTATDSSYTDAEQLLLFQAAICVYQQTEAQTPGQDHELGNDLEPYLPVEFVQSSAFKKFDRQIEYEVDQANRSQNQKQDQKGDFKWRYTVQTGELELVARERQ